MVSLIQKEILLLDGGLGTTLEDEHGVKFSHNTPLWSSHLLLTDQNVILKAQTDFVNAGANIILTPTYQASHEGFRKSGIENVADFLKDAIQISSEASKGKALVALSLGAYGAILQPSQEFSGNYDIDEAGLVKFHAERLDAFENLWDSIDLVAFETLPRLNEVRAVKQAYNGIKPYWISCVFPHEDRLPDDSSIDELLPAMLAGEQPWAIGMNCTKVYKIEGLVTTFERVAEELGLELPRLVIYPDGTNGQVYDSTLQQWVGDEKDQLPWDQQVADIVMNARQRGRWKGIVVGGCCKAAPRHIRLLAERLHKLV